MSDETQTNVTESTESPQTKTTIRSGGSPIQRILRRREIGVFFGFIVLVVLIAITRPDIFFDWGTMSNIVARLLRQVSPYVIIGIGMTYLIISGEFDLSVGSMYAVGGLLFVMLLTEYRLTVVAALVFVLFASAIIGLINGGLVTKAGVPSLIATIGMLSVLRGIAYYLTPAGSRSVPAGLTLDVFGGSLTIAGIEIANQVLWSLGLLVVFGLVLQKTRLGYRIYATGDDAEAAKMTGINTDRVKIINFVFTAVLAAFAGILAVSYYGSMFGTAGRGFELLVIAAVIIGGTNLFGGEGTLLGMFFGALVIGVIPILLVLNGLPVEVQEFLTGAVIIIAVLLDIFIRR
jgi:ribose/xylose/arabinose/galactoside ABC-type transport system permease subunit